MGEKRKEMHSIVTAEDMKQITRVCMFFSISDISEQVLQHQPALSSSYLTVGKNNLRSPPPPQSELKEVRVDLQSPVEKKHSAFGPQAASSRGRVL